MSRLTGISLLSATNSKSISSNSISRSQSATECFPGHGRCCYIRHLLLQGIRGDLQSRYFLITCVELGPLVPQCTLLRELSFIVKCFVLSWVRDDTKWPGRLEASSLSRAFFVLYLSSSSRVSRTTSRILADRLGPACLLYSAITWWYHSACALRAWADTDFSLLNKRPHPTYGPTLGVAAVKGGLLCRCRVATPRAFKSGNRSFTLGGATPGSGGRLWASVSILCTGWNHVKWRTYRAVNTIG